VSVANQRQLGGRSEVAVCRRTAEHTSTERRRVAAHRNSATMKNSVQYFRGFCAGFFPPLAVQRGGIAEADSGDVATGEHVKLEPWTMDIGYTAPMY